MAHGHRARSLTIDGLLLLLASALGGCASGGTAPAPAEPEPAVASAPPSTLQPCPLTAAPLQVPVAEGWALASSPEGCLLVDEAHEDVLLTLAALADDQEGAELLESDPREFFRAAGLLGAAPRFTGRETIAAMGTPTEAQAFLAELEGLGPRAGLAVARRVGPAWVIALLIHAPGDQNARAALVRALEATRAGP